MNDQPSLSAGQFGELTLRDYLRLLRRQRWLVGAIFVAVVAAALGYTLLTPAQYQSTSSVLVRTLQNNQVFPTVGQSQFQQFIRTPAGEFAFVSSTSFQAEANQRAGGAATVTPLYDTNADLASVESQVISFRATAADAIDAQNAAQVWAELYIERRAESSALEIGAAIENISLQIERLEAEKAEILAPLAPIDNLLLSEDDPDIVARLTSQRLALQQSLDDELLPVRFQLRTLSDDLGRLEIAGGLADRSDISARINTAAGTGRQVAPQPMRNLALGAVLGALLGVGAGLLNDSLRVRLGGRDDVELVAPHLTVLAEIPPLPSDEATAEQRSRRMAHYGAEVERVVSSVAYQAAHLDPTDPHSCLRVMVTSARLGEGKSTLVQQLAHRLTESHIDTVVLDADLRRPVLHNRFGIANRGEGFRDLLGTSAPLEPHLVPIPDVPRLRLLPAGPATDAAAPLLRRSFSTAIDSMRHHSGVLVVDSPPVLAVTDAEIMANSVDHIVIAVRANVTTRNELAQTIERLASTRASILGIVLVGVEPADGNNGYGYGYGYGYSATPDSEEAQPIAQVGPPLPPERVFERQPQPVITPVSAPAAAKAPAAEPPAPEPQAPEPQAPEPPRENLADVIPLWLDAPATAEAQEEDAVATVSEAAATGTERPSPRSSSPARPTGPPLSNSAARGLAPIRNRRPSNRPRPRPKSEPTIDLR